MPEQLNHEKWTGKTDGTRWMHQALIRMFKYIDVRVVYVFMAIFVIPFYMLFVHSGYISMYHYFRQRRHYGAWKAFRYVYLNHYRFGQVILDRFAAYAGQTFQFELEGNELFQDSSSLAVMWAIMSWEAMRSSLSISRTMRLRIRVRPNQ